MVSTEELSGVFDQAVRNGRVAAGEVAAGEVAATGSAGMTGGEAGVTRTASPSRLVVGPAAAPLTRWLIGTGRGEDRHGEAVVDLEKVEYGPHAASAYEAAFAATLRGVGIAVRPDDY